MERPDDFDRDFDRGLERDIGWAMAAAQRWERVRRRSWPEGRWVSVTSSITCEDGLLEGEAVAAPVVIVHEAPRGSLAEGTLSIWLPTHEDLLGKDWQVHVEG